MTPHTSGAAELRRLHAELETLPVGYINRGIAPHTKGKTVFHEKPTRNLEERWWSRDEPVFLASKGQAPAIPRMTSEEYAALPNAARDYIHQIETNADPAGMVRENMQLRDTNAALEKMYRKVVDGQAPAQPAPAPMSPANRLVAYSAATRLRELGFEWDATAEAWLQPAPSAQAAESVPAEPLQDFESPNAQALMRAWEEGWEACRDAEYVGEEAQNDAFNNSNTLVICIAEDQRLPMPARVPADSVLEDAINVLRADLKASAKEIADEYAEDAARYRWLRNFHADEIHDDLPYIAAGESYVGAWALQGVDADKAIDSARKQGAIQ